MKYFSYIEQGTLNSQSFYTPSFYLSKNISMTEKGSDSEYLTNTVCFVLLLVWKSVIKRK